MKNPAGIQAFSQRLRFLRSEKGYSQQKLADIANMEQSTIRRIELAQHNPTLDVLISISQALGMEVRDLVDDPAITNPAQYLQSGQDAPRRGGEKRVDPARDEEDPGAD